MRTFFSDTLAVDTIPLKLVVYIGLLAAILILLAQAWHLAMPAIEDAEIEAQVKAASLSIQSIQNGYARDCTDIYSPEGTMCTLEFEAPASIRYVSFGVDPDPECDGYLGNSKWKLENNSVIYQYKNGVKRRVFLEGEPVHFIKGQQNAEEIWLPLIDKEIKGKFIPISLERNGVVIKAPASGEFLFEMVTRDGVKYTMTHF